MMKMKKEDSIIYLDAACQGLVPKAVMDDIRNFLLNLENTSSPPLEVVQEMYNCLPKARKALAELLRVSQEEIAIVESTSHGLGLIADSIPLNKENNILVSDLEFMAATICWRARQEREGFEIREVKTHNGEVRASDFKSEIDKNSKAIVISSVQEVNGFRTDIKEIRQLAKEYDCYLIVDGIQEAGALEVNLSELDVDVYCAGGHKWFRNPFGAGFLYINKKILSELKPDFYGYFNIQEPKGGWINYLESANRTPFEHFELLKSAAKFETGGTGNFIGIFGLYKSITLVLDYGIANIEKKVRELNEHLSTGLHSLDLKIEGSINPLYRSGITTFSMSGGPEQEKALHAELMKHNIYTSLRYAPETGGIRVAPHYYNSLQEIDLLLEVTKNFLNSNL